MFVGSTAVAGGAVDDLLSRNPVADADLAFAQGDNRYVVVPVCSGGGTVLPGWPLHESTEAWEAIEKGRRPITCEDIGPDPQLRDFKRVRKYAEQYNRRLLELSAKPSK